jgi:tetratricopeptide (TPR) repeat protein
MKDFPEGFYFLNHLRLLKRESSEEPHEFFFDDEPLERILYGEDRKGPTRANFFLPASVCKQKIVKAYKNGDLHGALSGISELGKKSYPMSIEACFELAAIISGIVPHYPNPVISFDLLALAPLIEQIWDLASERREERLQEAVGVSLYRWYEHQERFEDARRVLKTLIEIDREKGDRLDEATLINNFAFEYLLEGRYQEATPLFEEAARIFQEKSNEFEYVNVRSNYWICRVEYDDFDEFKVIEEELKAIDKILGKQTDWHARKPLILRAKIEERHGNISAAIQLVEQAIEVGKRAKTRYPELDSIYLEHLKNLMDLSRK